MADGAGEMRTRAIRWVGLLFCAVALVLAAGCERVWLCKSEALVEITSAATGEPAGDVQVAFVVLPGRQVDRNLRAYRPDVEAWNTVVTDAQGHASLPLEVAFFSGPGDPNYGTCDRAGDLDHRALLRLGTESDPVSLRLQAGASAVIDTYTIRVLEIGEWEACGTDCGTGPQ